jgi:hypothetical protein
MQLFRTLFIAALSLCALTAQAQWQWVDNAGRKVFSDQPPPPDIPTKNIVKQPGKSASLPAAPAATAAAPASTAPAAAAAPQLSAEDKDLMAKKKKADAEAQAHTKEEADKAAKAKAQNCDNAKANQAMLDSGVRIAVTNAKGEREFLDDDGRKAEAKRIRTARDANCP